MQKNADREKYIFTDYGEEEELHEVIGKAPCFELGCIFEIGRILRKNGIRFHGITITEQEPQTEGKRKMDKKQSKCIYIYIQNAQN